MAKGDNKKEAALRDAMKKAPAGAAKLAARGKLNDYLESIGRRTNRAKGEPVNGAGAGAGADYTTPGGVIAAQKAGASVQQYDPYGAQTVVQNPDGAATVTTGLSDPEQQKLGGEQRRDIEINTQIANALSQARAQGTGPLDTSGITPVVDASKFDIMGIQQALMGQKRVELERKHASELQNLQSQLVNRGIQPGSPRAQQEMQQIATRQDEEMRNAEAASYSNASTVGNTQNALYGTALNQRAQQYGELGDAHDQPYRDAANLSGLYGQKAVNNPNVQPYQAPDVQGTAMGFAGLGNDLTIANLNAKTSKEIAAANNAAQLKATSMSIAAANRGGAAAPVDDPEGEVDAIMPGSKARYSSNPAFGTRTKTNYSGRFF